MTPEKKRQNSKLIALRLRFRVLIHYGWACACCGSQDRLQLDHVDGNGHEHRQKLAREWGWKDARQISSTNMYRWLLRNNFPDGFQLLCLPCNDSKARSAGCRLDHHSEVS